MPSPIVDSAVIRLDVKPECGRTPGWERLMFRIIRAAFSQRRKQIANPLSAELHIAKPQLVEIMQSCGIKPTARAEELTLEDYAGLTDALFKGSAE